MACTYATSVHVRPRLEAADEKPSLIGATRSGASLLDESGGERRKAEDGKREREPAFRSRAPGPVMTAPG